MSEALNPRRVSASRIGKYSECGLAYKFAYVDKVPYPASGSAALFGTVLHAAREIWVLDRTLNLRSLVEKAWRDETKDDPSISAFLTEYQPLQARVRERIAQILSDRPDVKQVRSTKDWKESKEKRDVDALTEAWLPRLNESRWKFTPSDPITKLYDESLSVAARYERRWRHLPPAVSTEAGFEIEWCGFTLVGRIDEVGILLDHATGEMHGYTVEDAKTYREEPHTFRDSRQLVMYDLAVRDLVKRGVLPLDLEKYPLFPVIDLMRLCKKLKYPPVTPIDAARLKSELEQYERGVLNGVYLPAAKSCRAQFCDWQTVCGHHHSNQSAPVEIAA